MKLTVVAQVYNEYRTGNLIRFLNNVREFADNVVIFDDGSTDETADFLFNLSFSNQINLFNIRSDENDFKNEIAHKQMMLDTAINDLKTDWIMWLDADEVVEPRGVKGGIRSLCENNSLDGYAFHQINLWRTDQFYRIDNQYNDGIFVRLWRNNGKLKYDPKPGLHQRPYPYGVEKVADSDIQIIHYGFASDQAIVSKYRTYKDHGQTGWALQRLIDETTLQLKKSKSEWFNEPVQGPGIEVFNRKVAELV